MLMQKKANSKIKKAYSLIVSLGVTHDFTWSGRAKINEKEITKHVFSELVGIFSLVEELTGENRKVVEIGSKEFVRRSKELLKPTEQNDG
jgi:hypothetical protein